MYDTDRFANHNQSFKNVVHSNQTELSKCMWRLKNAKVNSALRGSFWEGRVCIPTAPNQQHQKMQLMYNREIFYNLSPEARHAQQTIRISKRLSACKQIPLKEIVIYMGAWAAG